MDKVIFAVVILYMSVHIAQPTQGHQQKDEHPWDLLIFTQQWPETVCKEWVHNNPSHTCVLPKKEDSWSIHGLWPTKIGTRGPAFCNRTWQFDPEEVRPIETNLMDKWVNIEGGTALYSFWAHEWNKHGTCAAVLPSFDSQLKYFSNGLTFFEKFYMGDILKKSNIVPDDDTEYFLLDINDAVKSALNVDPSIQCRFEDGKVYLVEIRICFDKNLKPHNCDGVDSSKDVDGVTVITNCDPDKKILYPHNKLPPKRIYVQLYKLISWLQWFTL